jgi:ABC-type proline/glycine betaine transport system permease subunit
MKKNLNILVNMIATSLEDFDFGYEFIYGYNDTALLWTTWMVITSVLVWDFSLHSIFLTILNIIYFLLIRVGVWTIFSSMIGLVFSGVYFLIILSIDIIHFIHLHHLM